MKLLLYEHLLATCDPVQTDHSLLREGRAMVLALVQTLSADSDCELLLPLHPANPWCQPGQSPWSKRWQTVPLHTRSDLDHLVNQADRILFIAPESDGCLATLLQCYEQCPNLLNAAAATVERLSDKAQLYHLFQPYAVPTTLLSKPSPSSIALSGHLLETLTQLRTKTNACLNSTQLPNWAILKPRRGAGAQFTVLAAEPAYTTAWNAIREAGYQDDLLLQPYLPGIPASVLMLRWPTVGTWIFPPVQQQLSVPPLPSTWAWIHYYGGQLPIAEPSRSAAIKLAQWVLDQCPDLTGLFGIDLILNPSITADAVHSWLVEINVRATTSLVALAPLFPNLIESWLTGRVPNSTPMTNSWSTPFVLPDPATLLTFTSAGEFSTQTQPAIK